MADYIETVPATGFISAPLRLLVTNLSASRAFQERLGQTFVPGINAAALQRIAHPHLVNADELSDVTGCWGVIWTEEFRMTRVSNFGFRPSGTISLLLRDDDKYPQRSDYSQIDFENFVGGVMSDLAKLVDAAPDFILPFSEIRMAQRPRISHPKNNPQAAFWYTIFDFILGRV